MIVKSNYFPRSAGSEKYTSFFFADVEVREAGKLANWNVFIPKLLQSDILPLEVKPIQFSFNSFLLELFH